LVGSQSGVHLYEVDLGYLAQINETAVEMAYYSGGYDPTLPRLDFAVEDTIGIS
jgi:hypothetical protein